MPRGQNATGGHLSRAKAAKPDSRKVAVSKHFAARRMEQATNSLRPIASRQRLSQLGDRLVHFDLSFARPIVKPQARAGARLSDENDVERRGEQKAEYAARVTYSATKTYSTRGRARARPKPISPSHRASPTHEGDAKNSDPTDSFSPSPRYLDYSLNLVYRRRFSSPLSPPAHDILITLDSHVQESPQEPEEEESMTVDPHPRLDIPDMDVSSRPSSPSSISVSDPEDDCTLATPLHSPTSLPLSGQATRPALEAFQHCVCADEPDVMESLFRESTMPCMSDLETPWALLPFVGGNEEQEPWLVVEDWGFDFEPVEAQSERTWISEPEVTSFRPTWQAFQSTRRIILSPTRSDTPVDFRSDIVN